jgi:hypothetical protein
MFLHDLLSMDLNGGGSFSHIVVGPKVSDDDNARLLPPMLDDEIRTAVFSSDGDKAPSPDVVRILLGLLRISSLKRSFIEESTLPIRL